MQKTEPEQIDANYGTMTEIAGKFKFEHLENEIIFNTVFQHKKNCEKISNTLTEAFSSNAPSKCRKISNEV